MKESIKSSFVFIGTVIGAGFATGQEVLLYFKDSSVLVCIFAGVMLGVFSSAFMLIGHFYKPTTFYKLTMFICSFISFIAMFSGVKVLFVQLFNIDYVDILITILASIIVMLGIEKIKVLNLIAVPIIVIFIILLFCNTGCSEMSGSYNFSSGMLYATMNMIVSSGVLMRLSRNMSKRNILSSGVISAVILSGLLVLVLLIIRGRDSEMPLLSAAENAGLWWGAGIAIFLSIFTTMVSSLDMAVMTISSFKISKPKSLLFVIILALPFKLMFSFENIVSFYYPVMSVIGIVLIIEILARTSKKYIEIFDNTL